MAKIRELHPDLAALARVECLEKDDEVGKEIEAFRAWIEEQPYLTARADDQFLVAFLRFCKYDMESAKKRLDFYYTYKSTAGDLLKSRRIDEKLYTICKAGVFVTLPNPVGAGGPRIHYTRMGNIDTSLFSVQDLFRYHMFRSEIEINTDDNWVIGGVIEIIDCSKIPFSFLRQFDSNLFRKMAAFLEYGVPTNLRATHIVNASREVQLILSLVRSLMKQKELLHIHSNIESLQNAIGKEYLPVELGGNNGTLEESIERYENLLNDFQAYFLEDDKYGVDEQLRPPTPTSNQKSSKSVFNRKRSQKSNESAEVMAANSNDAEDENNCNKDVLLAHA